ncbi:hypothetical protein DUT91_14960 [Phyllobacterium salinisoli]|uniref:Uncharacterized protein n=1 Tax=Phyllobacterium salinisoli TaxID=1899321 RepID=A0A368K2U7_9HYPH|nr:hypothetical protein DUT91_14960 [Phyllobacterium salinisoli]
MLEHLPDLTTTKLSGARIMADSDNSRTLPPVTRDGANPFRLHRFAEHQRRLIHEQNELPCSAAPQTGSERHYS